MGEAMMSEAAMGEVLLEAKGVRKQFFRKGRTSARNFDAVAGVDLQLARGQLVELTGRSGSGKSTLLNMMAGLLEPTEGQVLFDGQDLYALDDERLSRLRNAHFGMIPQGQSALPTLSVVQNVMIAHCMYRADDEAEARAFELLERLGIADLADAFPNELSGGELRRMAIARALAVSPDVLFADEPTGDLDDENTAAVLRVLRDAADAGAAVLLVTHEQAAEAYADCVIRMEAGKWAAA